ncbi:MAG: hypothetical protein V3574_04370 [Candidatus Moraniibacteriota bacterium]
MAFKKQTQAVYQREEANFSDEDIKAFEKELDPYMKRRTQLFNGQEITGFELYLHNNLLFRFSPKYPTGAVVAINAEKYRESKAKYSALCTLWYKRQISQEKETEKIQSIKL